MLRCNFEDYLHFCNNYFISKASWGLDRLSGPIHSMCTILFPGAIRMKAVLEDTLHTELMGKLISCVEGLPLSCLTFYFSILLYISTFHSLLHVSHCTSKIMH